MDEDSAIEREKWRIEGHAEYAMSEVDFAWETVDDIDFDYFDD